MLPDDAASPGDLPASLDEAHAFHGAPCGLLSTGPEGWVRCANATLLGWLGLDRDGIAARRFQDLLTPGGRLYAETHLLPMLRVRGAFQEVALPLRAADGGDRHVLASARLRAGPGGGGAAADFAFVPNDHRRSYERELVAMRSAAQTRVNLLRQVEEMAGVGAWVLDAADRRVTWSDGIFHLHGLPPGEAPDLERALSFYAPNARRRVAEAVARALSTGQPFEVEAELVTAQGRARRVRLRGEGEREAGRIARVAGVIQDVTERHEVERRLWRGAHVDELSGLANRAWFRAMLAERLASGGTALLLLDLDGFKAVNDSLGHAAGDAVIRAVAEGLRSACGEEAFPARLGGDEFGALCDADRAEEIALAVRQATRRPVLYEDGEAAVTASIGWAVAPRDAATPDALMRAADAALYEAKRGGRDRVVAFGAGHGGGRAVA